jgi:hypothetical protein
MVLEEGLKDGHCFQLASVLQFQQHSAGKQQARVGI